MNNPFIIGISGGSGSGKTFVANTLFQKLGPKHCLMIQQDSYYLDQSHRFDCDGGAVNFDHPDAIDFELLAKHLQMLKKGESVNIPIYDFATHKRLPQTEPATSRPVIIVDGILILHHQYLRTLFNESLFVATPEELRYERRLNRDTMERGRTAEGVLAQFVNQVKPMHDQFVEPSKQFATLIGHGHNIAGCEEAISYLLTQIS